MAISKDLFQLIYFIPLKALLGVLPLGRVYGLAKLGAALIWRLRPGRLAALGRAALVIDPLMPKADVEKAVKRALFNQACQELELLLYPKLSPAWVERNLPLQGREHLDAALAKGKGAMLVFGHFGANLMVMPAIGYRGYKMSQLSAPATVLKEKLPGAKSRITRWALDRRWEHENSLPAEHINIFGSLKPAFKCLREGRVLGLAVDGGGGTSRVAAPFLGRSAHFSLGGLSLALRTGCAVVPAFMLRGADGTNRLVLAPALELPQGPDKEENLRELLKAFVAVFEPYVRKYPCHYLNFLAFREFMAAHGDPPFLS